MLTKKSELFQELSLREQESASGGGLVYVNLEEITSSAYSQETVLSGKNFQSSLTQESTYSLIDITMVFNSPFRTRNQISQGLGLLRLLSKFI